MFLSELAIGDGKRAHPVLPGSAIRLCNLNFAENQGSDTVVVFRIDSKTGKLTPTGDNITVGSPVCAVFVPTK